MNVKEEIRGLLEELMTYLLAPFVVARLVSRPEPHDPMAGWDASDREVLGLLGAALSEGGQEVAAGRLAGLHSRNSAIADFGRRMAAYHDTVRTRLAGMADELGLIACAAVPLPDGLEKLQQLQQGRFDPAYLRLELSAQGKMKEIYLKLAAHNRFPELVSFAVSQLDMVDRNREEARSLLQGMS